MPEKPQAHHQFMTEFPAIAAVYQRLATAAHDNGLWVNDILANG